MWKYCFSKGICYNEIHLVISHYMKWESEKRGVQGNFTLCAVIIFQVHPPQKSHSQLISQSQMQINLFSFIYLKRWSSDNSDAYGNRHCLCVAIWVVIENVSFQPPLYSVILCTVHLLWACRYKYLILDLHFKACFQTTCNTFKCIQ